MHHAFPFQKYDEPMSDELRNIIATQPVSGDDDLAVFVSHCEHRSLCFLRPIGVIHFLFCALFKITCSCGAETYS